MKKYRTGNDNRSSLKGITQVHSFQERFFLWFDFLINYCCVSYWTVLKSIFHLEYGFVSVLAFIYSLVSIYKNRRSFMFEVYDVVIEECCTGECRITAIVSRAVVSDITDFFLYLAWVIQNKNNNNNFLVVVFTFCVQQGARLQQILQQWWFKPWQIFWDTANDFPVNGCMRKCRDIILSIVLKSIVSVSFPVILTGRPASFFLHKSMSFKTDCTQAHSWWFCMLSVVIYSTTWSSING